MALQGEDLIAACSIMPRTEVQELEEAVSHHTKLSAFLKTKNKI